VAVVLVEPLDTPPVRYQERVWVRIGPRPAVASPEEERRLTEKRRARDLPFDLHPVASATLDDLDLDLFRRTYLPASVANDVLDQNQRSIEEQLTSLRLAAANGLAAPTVVGILVTGREPLRFLPGAYVQFLRVDGRDLSDPLIDVAELSGPLPRLLRAVEEKLQAHLETAHDLTAGPTESVHPDYPHCGAATNHAQRDIASYL
jgi:ATP-dependent DNA helicase RecG